jgi:rod shape-determining protein MreC
MNQHAYQRFTFLNSSNEITSRVYESFRGVTMYLDFNHSNLELVQENLRLHKQINDQKVPNPYQSFQHGDFKFISARVINNTIYKRSNMITIHAGRNDGVRPDMAVISPSGGVGVTYSVSNNYCVAVSLLNEQFKLSAKIKKNGYFGSLKWDPGKYRYAMLTEIPTHVNIELGDTVITSGYSSIFPEGYMVGTIDEIVLPPGSNFYEISVLLAVDFKSLDYVYLVDNRNKLELNGLKEIEPEVSHD